MWSRRRKHEKSACSLSGSAPCSCLWSGEYPSLAHRCRSGDLGDRHDPARRRCIGDRAHRHRTSGGAGRCKHFSVARTGQLLHSLDLVASCSRIVVFPALPFVTRGILQKDSFQHGMLHWGRFESSGPTCEAASPERSKASLGGFWLRRPSCHLDATGGRQAIHRRWP